MDICIGGPWDGSRILKSKSPRKRFILKDSTGRPITYERRLIKHGEEELFFWIDTNLNLHEVNEKLKKYL